MFDKINRSKKSVRGAGRTLWLLPVLVLSLSLDGLCGGFVDLYFPDSRPDTYLTLYSPGDQTSVIAENDDVAPGSGTSRIVSELDANQTYYVKVSVLNNEDRDDTGYYRISVNGPGDETGGTASGDVTPLVVNGPAVMGQLQTEDQEDWYVFETTHAGFHTINAGFDREHIAEGIPSRWKRDVVEYNIEQGPLGALDFATASQLVEDCLRIWQDVPTSSLQFQRGPDLDLDFSVQDYGPSPRFLHQMFYDAVREKVVLLDGTEPNNQSFLSDMWEWDGERWNIMTVEDRPYN